jgi:hypothetical protein
VSLASLHRAVLPFLVLLAVWLSSSRARAECAARDRFTFEVERPGGRPAKGLQLDVEAGGSRGVRRATDVVSDSGSALLCILDANSGEMVDVRVRPSSFRILYPPRARLALTREGSPSIVVCEAGRDCGLQNAEDVAALIQKARSQAKVMDAEQKAAFFREWLIYARQLSQETSAENEKLFSALVSKERQITASVRASKLLRRFGNRARELVVRFERHAERALAYPTPRPIQQINQASLVYNPVFDEISEHADAYRKETADYWNAEVSGQFQALVDEALEIHRQDIYTLNAVLTLINDCRHKQRGCPGADRARARVKQAVRRAHTVTEPRLDRFEKRTRDWLKSLDDKLFAEPIRPPIRPAAPDPRIAPRRDDHATGRAGPSHDEK